MDKDVAWQSVKTAFRCGTELQSLLHILQQKCSAEEYKKFRIGIARAIDTINVELIDPALEMHPELKDRIENGLGSSGHIE